MLIILQRGASPSKVFDFFRKKIMRNYQLQENRKPSNALLFLIDRHNTSLLFNRDKENYGTILI